MKRSVILIFVAAIILGITVWSVRGQQPSIAPAQEQLKPVMQHKLEFAKGILGALAVEDFDKLAQNAQSLSLLSLESNWNVLTTDEYIQQSADFRRACGVIKEAAHEKNDGSNYQPAAPARDIAFWRNEDPLLALRAGIGQGDPLLALRAGIGQVGDLMETNASDLRGTNNPTSVIAT
jgi:hypothetical protein